MSDARREISPRHWAFGLLGCLLVMVSTGSLAVIETYEFSSTDLEQRYHQLSQELRCPKCQNQNIADSNAPISKDLRQLLYQQLEEGASDEEILDYMVARYGEFVRYRPAADGATRWLWLAPLIMLLLGAAAFVLLVRQGRRGAPAVDAPSSADRERLRALLDAEERS